MDLGFDAKHSFARLLDAVAKRASGNGVGHGRTPLAGGSTPGLSATDAWQSRSRRSSSTLEGARGSEQRRSQMEAHSKLPLSRPPGPRLRAEEAGIKGDARSRAVSSNS